MNNKARILFVDDEKRVLNSMRGLFRREYELFLTTVGADAVKIAGENDVDVVVADQRMPGMTGIEVLGKIKETSPRTVRILLTGYADPSAVEGSINIGEVFRFLSKPCPPKLLRETLGLAIDAARTLPVVQSVATSEPSTEAAGTAAAAEMRPETPRQGVPQPEAPPREAPQPVADVPSRRATEIEEPIENLAPESRGDDDDTEPALPILDLDEIHATRPASTPTASHWQSVTNVVLSEDKVEETQENAVLPANLTRGIKDVGVVVFTVDSTFAETAIRALSADRNTILATSLVKVAQAVETHKAGVLVTDFTTNSAVLQKMIGALKQYMPELMTIVVSSGRDTTDMINLINYGQVFRYVLKPIDAVHLRNDVNAAAIRCLYLQNNPESVKRHQVIETPVLPDPSATMNRFLGRIRKIQSERSDSTDVASE